MSDLATEIGQGGGAALTLEQAQFASDAASLAQQAASTGLDASGNSIGRPNFLGSLKASLGKAQAAVVAPVQSFASNAAKSAGATDKTAETVGAGFLPALLIAAAAAVVLYFMKFRKRNVTA